MTERSGESPFVFEATFDDEFDSGEPTEFLGNDLEARGGGATTGGVLASPFVLELELSDETVREAPEDEEAFAHALVELQDNEFDETIADLFADAQMVADKLSAEIGNEPEAIEGALLRHYEAMAQASERGIDDVADEMGEHDLDNLAEGLLDEYADVGAIPSVELDSPVQEDFFRKIVRRAKRAVRRVAKRAKKFANRFNPIKGVLKKLKKLVRPLLRRVLRGAINRLPVPLRPVARRLARKILREVTDEELSDPIEGQAAEISPIQIAREYDLVVAELVTDGDDAPAVDEYIAESEHDNSHLEKVEQAREEFIEAFASGDEANIEAKTEEFVTALLPALRLGIRLAGRGRVVNTIAGYLAPLIRKAVGRRYATALSRAITDQGLKLLSLEAGEKGYDEPGDPRIAAEAMADTVEETTIALAQSLVSDSDPIEGEVVAATFANVSAENFPHSVISNEVESFASRGTWVRRPARGRRRYKKFSQVFDVAITPSMARSVFSFGGVSLHRFLTDVMGQSPTGTVKAKMHVYEAVRGTTLSRLTLLERGVYGLGSGRRAAWSQIHLLSSRAAGTLVRDPALGRDVASRWTRSRHRIKPGQRFFYLEIQGADPATVTPRPRPRPKGGTPTPTPTPKTNEPKPTVKPRVARPGQVRVTVDLKRGKIRTGVYFAERDAAAVSQSLKSGHAETAIVKAMFASLESAERQANANPRSLVRVIGTPFDFVKRKVGNVGRTIKGIFGFEAEEMEDALDPLMSTEGLLPAKAEIAKMILERLKSFVVAAIKGRLMELRDEWIRKQEHGADGLTVRLEFDLPDEVTEIAKLMSPALYLATELKLSIRTGRQL